MIPKINSQIKNYKTQTKMVYVFRQLKEIFVKPKTNHKADNKTDDKTDDETDDEADDEEDDE